MRSLTDIPLLRSPLAALLALAAALVLLLLFSQVVLAGVRQGAERRVDASAQADAAWRCGLSKSARARAECLGAFQSSRVAGRGATP